MSKGVVCVCGDKLVNMKDSHKVVAQSSPLRACHHFKDGVHWRNIIVRSNRHGDLMAIVVIHPKSLVREDIVEEARLIAEFFSEGEGKECGLTSLYFQSLKLPRVIEELDSAPDIVAVINPGRGGVGHHLIQAVRECKQIERVVYVSCDAEGAAMKNFIQLCAPSEHKKKLSKRGGGSAPFLLTRAIPIVIFPHTAHCEIVLLFERKP